MIPRPILLALLLLPANALAETVICIGEAGAAVEHGGPAGINSGLYDVSNAKYVLSDVSGSWQFKQLGQDSSPLTCLNGHYCEVQGGFSTFFMRERDSNIFTYVGLVAHEPDFKRSVVYTVKGRCSSL